MKFSISESIYINSLFGFLNNNKLRLFKGIRGVITHPLFSFSAVDYLFPVPQFATHKMCCMIVHAYMQSG